MCEQGDFDVEFMNGHSFAMLLAAVWRWPRG